MKKLNNKGYMLVEIILAFSICFALMYFLMDIVIKVKNKNDDLLVEATVKTDQAIITNRLMEYIISEKETFSCNIDKENNAIKYNENILTVVDSNAVVTIDSNSCINDTTNKIVTINIPIEVKQMPDKNFNVNINYNYGSTLTGLPTDSEPSTDDDSGDTLDTTAPTCTITVSGTTITASSSDTDLDNTTISTKNPGWEKNDDNTYTKTFNLADTYTFEVTDTSGNTGSCSIEIKKKTTSIWGSSSCPYGQPSYTAIEGTDYCYR